MLGVYQNFPENVHHLAFFKYHNPTKSVQRAVLYAVHKLNNETFDVCELTPYLKQNMQVGLEFGIADGVDFVFLGQNELEECLKIVDKKELRTLDFFFVTRYHLTKNGGKQVPLRFDYQVFRLLFRGDQLEARIRHERGTQRVQLDELTNFVIQQINKELTRRHLSPLISRELDNITVD